MSFRLAAHAVCIEEGRVLLARYVSPTGDTNWTLPGGKVEQAEDPFDAVVATRGGWFEYSGGLSIRHQVAGSTDP
ncbi:NUDIX domain-containing protein [Micromonospora arida]|uniref:NUDIX domain-containing protein n=1 Tax=Micromonospora arida TaxID=2203715 RepID=UPI0033D21C9C